MPMCRWDRKSHKLCVENCENGCRRENRPNFSYDLDRMKAAMDSGKIPIPSGLSREEMRTLFKNGELNDEHN